MIILFNLIFLSKHILYIKNINPLKKPTNGSWIAYSQNQTPPWIKKHNVSVNAPINKPIIGPKNHPTKMVGNHPNEILIPIVGILIEIKSKTIDNAINNPNNEIKETDFNTLTGYKGNKNWYHFCLI